MQGKFWRWLSVSDFIWRGFQEGIQTILDLASNCIEAIKKNVQRNIQGVEERLNILLYREYLIVVYSCYGGPHRIKHSETNIYY